MRPERSRFGYFATRLTFFRQANGLTQQQFADLLDINLRTYQRFESGELLPKIDFLYQFLEKTSVSLDYFFSSIGDGVQGDFWALSVEQDSILAPLFLPCETEMLRWRSVAKDPLVLKVIEEARTSRSGNAAAYVSTFKGTHQSPGYCDISVLADFAAYGENTGLEVMADYWVRALCSETDSFLLRFEMDIGGVSSLVASMAVWSKSFNRTVVYGTTYDLSQRPDINCLIDDVCGKVGQL